MTRIGQVLMIMIVIALIACEQDNERGAVDDPVLARVGSSAIHQSQLEVMLDRVKTGAADQSATRLEKTLLEGMVRTRALAIVAEQQMNAGEKRELHAKVDNYRDELLAQAYIRKNIAPQPVTADMVKQYYVDHQADYTIPGKVSFEVITTTSQTLDDAVLDQVLAAFSTAASVADWKTHAAELEQQGMPVAYSVSKLPPTAIDKALRAQLARLQAGEVSDVVYGDAVYIARLIAREPPAVRPLHEVSVEIRKKLAPQKLKQALAQHIEDALTDMDVEYTK